MRMWISQVVLAWYLPSQDGSELITHLKEEQKLLKRVFSVNLETA
jgi:hypothetical protein